MWKLVSKWVAKRVGFSGKKTLCAECYRRKERICRLIKRVFGEQHCARQASDERA